MTPAQITALAIIGAAVLFALYLVGHHRAWWIVGVVVGAISLFGLVFFVVGMLATGLFPWEVGFWGDPS